MDASLPQPCPLGRLIATTPHLFAAILCEHLRIDDVAAVDVALCSRSIRPNYLALLTQQCLNNTTRSARAPLYEASPGLLSWLRLRKLSVNAISISDNFFIQTAALVVESIFDIDKLVLLQVHGYIGDIDGRAMVFALVESLPCLTRLDVSKCDWVNEQVLTKLLDNKADSLAHIYLPDGLCPAALSRLGAAHPSVSLVIAPYSCEDTD